jgi:hypothetical protein
MKTKKGLIALIVLLNIVSASAQDLFEKLGDNEHITSVYISKALLNMFPGMADKVNVDGVDIKNIVAKLEQIDIYTSSNKEGLLLIRTEAKKLQSQSKSYEVLMKIKDDGNNVIFYAEKSKDKDRFKSLIMFADDGDECTLIRLLGSFTAEDIQNITK